jgi:hypothetical protein
MSIQITLTQERRKWCHHKHVICTKLLSLNEFIRVELKLEREIIAGKAQSKQKEHVQRKK